MNEQAQPDRETEHNPKKTERNDVAGTGDDTLGENTEETPLAEEINNGGSPGEKITPSEELE